MKNTEIIKRLSFFRPRIVPVPAPLSFYDWHVLAATFFHTGRLRPASGTIGSMAALPIGYAIAVLGGPFALLAAAMAVLAIGIKSAGVYGRASGESDDSSIVIDEVAGLWIATLPAENFVLCWVLAFLLFRLFDIIKPWPASFFDKRKTGGFDVMMDDIVAGVFAFGFVALVSSALLDKQ